MRFNRVDDNRVECIISESDLEEYGVELEDLFTRSGNAMDFLKEVVERAREEVDYNPKGGVLPMQLNVLEDHSICVILGESDNSSFDDMIKFLKNHSGADIARDIVNDIADSIAQDLEDDLTLENMEDENMTNEERVDMINEYISQIHSLKDSKDNKDKNNKDNNDKNSNDNTNLKFAKIFKNVHGKVNADSDNLMKKIPGLDVREKKHAVERLENSGFVFAFSDMKAVISFCRIWNSPIRMASSLYHDKKRDVYFLHMRKGRESVVHFAGIFNSAYEFGSFYTSDPIRISYIEESTDCLIANKAVNLLKKFQ